MRCAYCALRVLQRASFHLHQFKPHIALELIGGLLAGLRVILALARLAQMARYQEAVHAAVHVLPAALLDENTGDGRLARFGREGLALPSFAPEPRIEKVAQQIGLLAVTGRIARVGDDADTAHDASPLAVVADQNRYVDRKAVGLGADILLHLGGEIVGLGPIFELVVIAEIHFAQPARVGTATPVVLPAGERRRRRAAIGPPGVIDIIVPHLGNLRTHLHFPHSIPPPPPPRALTQDPST